jgi:hypothetical protein
MTARRFTATDTPATIRWATAPDPDDQPTPVRLIRVGPKQPLEIVITAEQVLGVYTHWYTGRTVPCTRPTCDACQLGNEPRWHGYVSAISCRTGEHAIVELTATATPIFERWRQSHSTIRGAKATLARLGKRPNGRVIVKLDADDVPGRILPEQLDLQRLLTRVWRWQAPTNHKQPTPGRNGHGTPA